MKKFFSILFVSLFAAGLLSLAVYGFFQYRKQVVNKVVVHIERNGKKGFLTSRAVKKMIRKQEKVIGKQIKQVNTAEIEKIVARNPYVKNVDVYFNIFGDMMVNVRERVPLLQVYNLKNRSCYIDRTGTIIPLDTAYAPRVLLANGYIRAKLKTGKNIFDKSYRHTNLPVLFLLAEKIRANRFLNAGISQLFVNSRGNIDMVPELGGYIIHFGDSSRMNTKLENWEAFSKQVFAHGGWSKYSSINLEFTNQIVCTKK